MAKTLLLVDDSRTALMLQRAMLAETGYEIDTAANGRAALDRARERRPDLVLMDVMMPEMDGFQAVRAMRADAELASVPIIMVTTRSESVNVAEGFAAGCTDYLTKPFNARELLDKIREHLDRCEEAAGS
ncbi:response regulator [Pseudenhygromyxa sp. WMMC2535]|uniref:response regulator n=1 Tax=Pseudenhygromyxa sp. WMMC2535 TaxID=2712867 RepID=UPI001551D2BD|nr:response regulator [Pseudenhygromyxa sp. WMMC2535]NVB37863.1 response regulator [Pseudenhygromyxa sp. WMMC2535]